MVNHYLMFGIISMAVTAIMTAFNPSLAAALIVVNMWMVAEEVVKDLKKKDKED